MKNDLKDFTAVAINQKSGYCVRWEGSGLLKKKAELKSVRNAKSGIFIVKCTLKAYFYVMTPSFEVPR